MEIKNAAIDANLAQQPGLAAIREVIASIKIEISDDGTTIVKDYRMAEWADKLARAIGGENLRGADLRGANLRNANLHCADLRDEQEKGDGAR